MKSFIHIIASVTRRPLSNWRLLTLASLISLLALELSLRCLWGFGNPLLLQKDPDIGYLYQPNQDLHRLGNRVIINAYHQRSGPVTQFPNTNTTRIMLVGDSVTFGTTLLDQKQTISELLQADLKTSKSGPVEVLNASAGSWGIGNELAYLKRFGTMGACVVVIQIGSHDLLQQKSTSFRVGVDPNQPDKRPLTAISEVWRRYIQPCLAGSATVAIPALAEDPDSEARFTMNMDFLIEGIRFVHQHGATPVILHTPDRDEVLKQNDHTETKYQSWRRRFVTLAERERVPLVNLPELWQRDARATLYFRDHVHLTAAGTAAAANAVYKLLQVSCAQALCGGTQVRTAASVHRSSL